MSCDELLAQLFPPHCHGSNKLFLRNILKVRPFTGKMQIRGKKVEDI